MILVGTDTTTCPHCGSENIDRGFTGLDQCNACDGLFRRQSAEDVDRYLNAVMATGAVHMAGSSSTTWRTSSSYGEDKNGNRTRIRFVAWPSTLTTSTALIPNISMSAPPSGRG